MNKVWFITGATTGIGAAMVKAALDAGDCVMATGRSVAKLRAAFRQDDRLAVAELDVVKEGDAKATTEETLRQFGRIDVLVNNAGYSILGNFEEITSDELRANNATQPSLVGCQR